MQPSTPEGEKRAYATSMIVYLCLVKGRLAWSDADVLIYEQMVKDLNIKT